MTEVTYWSGQAEPELAPFGGKAALEEMRQQFIAGDYNEGDRLAKLHLQPKKRNFGTNLGLCEVVIDFAEQDTNAGGTEVIERELDLTCAVARTVVRSKGTTLHREMFASHADDLVVSRIWSDVPGGVSFTIGLEGGSASFTTEVVDDGTIAFKGQATENVHSNGTCGVWAKGQMKVSISGGTMYRGEGQLRIAGANEARIYFAVSTDYQRSNSEWEMESGSTLQQASIKGYAQLKEDHIDDYEQEYGKVDIQLGTTGKVDLPTDQRIRLLAQDPAEDSQLFALFLQYGRYLTIAGSREDSPLPLTYRESGMMVRLAVWVGAVTIIWTSILK
jgi:alpha-L-fucosidase 2